MSLKNLINKSKGLSNETKNNTTEIIRKPISNILQKSPVENKNIPDTSKPTTKPAVQKPFKLGLGKGVAKTEPVSTDEKCKSPVHNKFSINSPIKQLADVMQSNEVLSDNSITSILGDISDTLTPTPETSNAEASQSEAVQRQVKSTSNTLEDLGKFVFEEQPDESTEEIAMKFSGMLDGLGAAVGSDIPSVLSETLSFMKQHDFLAEILKPEEVGSLVKTMAKSYGYVANNQTQKAGKSKAKAVEQNQILNSLDMLKF